MTRTAIAAFTLALCICFPSLSRAASGVSERQTMEHDGRQRSYVIRVPGNLSQHNTPAPLVIVLHGGGGEAYSAEKMTGFSDKAEKEGFIVVYPNGSGRLKRKLLTWNARHCCGYAMDNDSDDVGFIKAMIDRISTEYPVIHGESMQPACPTAP